MFLLLLKENHPLIAEAKIFPLVNKWNFVWLEVISHSKVNQFEYIYKKYISVKKDEPVYHIDLFSFNFTVGSVTGGGCKNATPITNMNHYTNLSEFKILKWNKASHSRFVNFNLLWKTRTPEKKSESQGKGYRMKDKWIKCLV